MQVDFFERELSQTKEKFNQTFGVMPLCKANLRIKVIFAIAQMGILQKKIQQDKRKEDICRFVQKKNALNQIFAILTKERKKHDKKYRSN